jgi:hypothetical protein
MTAPGPRPDVRLLAELDAGLLDEARARAVRAAVAADPAAQAVLHALAATRAELAALPDPPVPPALAARWSAALAAEQSALLADTAHPPDTEPSRATPEAGPPPGTTAEPSTTHPVRALPTPQAPREEAGAARGPDAGPADAPAPPPPVPADLPTPPLAAQHAERGRDVRPDGRGPRRRDDSSPPSLRRRNAGPRLLRRPAVLAAALLVAVGIAAGLHARREPPPPTIGGPQLAAEAVTAVGVRDTAGLDDPARREGCLRAVGGPVIDPAAPLLGGRRVTFEDNPGVLLVLGTGQRGAFDVLIVDPDCGPSGGRLLASTHVAPS